ncbi:hypothetical protein CKM354_000609900 [Cercospora kikuchii]|uniref:Uncharacterized protein n=1 Tax=Cercospora kikuchii TaxID=84275 RepID=A0A9P3CIR9_9PEZI|nr:uncharacterized protein CKM354_000609900 [Cercospora kikuchii]GIZ42846.1 hypothetical protein CKM354_000609900 [Cercospora kikuchii]
MDSKDPHTGVRIHEGECRDWDDEKTFDAFVAQWMPNMDGEDPGCHKPCDGLVYDNKHCGRPDGVKIKESPQRYPIYNIGVNKDTHWGRCQSFQTHNITAKGRSVELHCGRKWFDYSANGAPLLSSNHTQAQPLAGRG